MSSEIKILSLRSFDDFFEASGFQLPTFNDPDKWANRVFNNLLYYQTNYFYMSVIVFLIVGFMHPAKMLFGILAISAAFALFFALTYSRTATKFKRDHPILSLLAIFAVGYFVVYKLGSVLVFLFGVMLPITLIFIHASLRRRSLKNKLCNKIEIPFVRKTPMGLFLDALGQELTLIS